MMKACVKPCVCPSKSYGTATARARRGRVARCFASGATRMKQGEPLGLVIGAGIGGLSAAVALQKIGYPVLVLEREAELREEGSAIAFWTNAFSALEALDVAEPLRRDHPALHTIQLCDQRGVELRAFGLSECEGGPHELRGLRRATLLKQLAAQLPEGTVRYGCSVEDITTDTQSGCPVVSLRSGDRVDASLVVGADGARSIVARHLGLPLTNYAGYTAYRGVAELESSSIPVPMGICRQMYGQGVRAGMYPVSACEVCWYVCFNAPFDSPAPASGAEKKADALQRVRGWGGGIVECMRATPAGGVSRSRIGDRWVAAKGKGLFTLAGDALHPMTPNLGQGGGTAIEDAVVLAKCLKAAGGINASSQELDRALRDYEQERAKRALPITIKAGVMGAALQIDSGLVCAVRNVVMSKLFNPRSFLSHAEFKFEPL